MAALRALLQGAAEELLQSIPSDARTLVVGLATPERALAPRPGLHCLLQRVPAKRRRSGGAAVSRLVARLDALPVAAERLDALLLVGPIGGPLGKRLDRKGLVALTSLVHEGGRLLLAEPIAAGFRGLVLRASERGHADTADLSQLFLLAGLADIRQSATTDGRWILTRAVVRKLPRA